jgi:hypothetical protein
VLPDQKAHKVLRALPAHKDPQARKEKPVCKACRANKAHKEFRERPGQPVLRGLQERPVLPELLGLMVPRLTRLRY